VKTVSGIIHGKTIELSEIPDLADGSAVEIVIRPARPHRLPGEGFARTEGALADDAEWDVIMEQVQHARRHERNIQE
jgi:hypothetical protein